MARPKKATRARKPTAKDGQKDFRSSPLAKAMGFGKAAAPTTARTSQPMARTSLRMRTTGRKDRERKPWASPLPKSLCADLGALDVDRIALDRAAGLLLQGPADGDDVAPDDGRGLDDDPRADADDGVADLAADRDRAADGDDALADLAVDDGVAADDEDVVLRFPLGHGDVLLDGQALERGQRDAEAEKDGQGEEGGGEGCFPHVLPPRATDFPDAENGQSEHGQAEDEAGAGDLRLEERRKDAEAVDEGRPEVPDEADEDAEGLEALGGEPHDQAEQHKAPARQPAPRKPARPVPVAK